MPPLPALGAVTWVRVGRTPASGARKTTVVAPKRT